MSKPDVNVAWNAGANHTPELEQFDSAIYFRFSVTRKGWLYQEAYAGISPTEARDIADALNREADAYEQREAEREDERLKDAAEKLPKTVGSVIQLPGIYAVYVRTDDNYWVNSGKVKNGYPVTDAVIAQYEFDVLYEAPGEELPF